MPSGVAQNLHSEAIEVGIRRVAGDIKVREDTYVGNILERTEVNGVPCLAHPARSEPA